MTDESRIALAGLSPAPGAPRGWSDKGRHRLWEAGCVTHSLTCDDCEAQRAEVTRARDLYVSVRLAYGHGASAKTLEWRITELEIALSLHECPNESSLAQR